MFNNKELIFIEDKKLPSIGYSSATFYIISNGRYRLYNLGYCPKEGMFYYNRNVSLPKNLIFFFENANISKEMEKEMRKYDIYSEELLDALMYYYVGASDKITKKGKF